MFIKIEDDGNQNIYAGYDLTGRSLGMFKNPRVTSNDRDFIYLADDYGQKFTINLKTGDLGGIPCEAAFGTQEVPNTKIISRELLMLCSNIRDAAQSRLIGEFVVKECSRSTDILYRDTKLSKASAYKRKHHVILPLDELSFSTKDYKLNSIKVTDSHFEFDYEGPKDLTIQVAIEDNLVTLKSDGKVLDLGCPAVIEFLTRSLCSFRTFGYTTGIYNTMYDFLFSNWMDVNEYSSMLNDLKEEGFTNE